MSTRPFAPALALLGLALAALTPAPAGAIPVFAHRYGLGCQACHTEVPHLTTFGEQFLANGYRIRGLKPKPVFPIAVRTQLAYSSAPALTDAGGKLPKVLVDEVELLTGGSLGTRGTYWAEVYAIDGGMPGRARDVWAGWRATPDGARVPVSVRAGQFTLPLPLDPETLRETTDHYAIWDQTAGDNPFSFFSPKLGAQIALGNPGRAIGGTVSVLQGHDQASGLPSYGLDTMLTLERELGDFRLQAYRYDGSRPLRRIDRFWRNGFGVGWERRRTRIDAVYQTGNDSAGDAAGGTVQTSGGFVELRQDVGARSFAIARWDATQGAAFARSVTYGFGHRIARNTRLTLFDTVRRDDNGRLQHVTSSSFLLAF